MRRAVPSFTVEVRRRPRLPITSNPGAEPSQSKPPQAAFDLALHGAAAAENRSPIDAAPSRPRGRILPSLVPDEPRHRLLEDAPVPATDSEQASRTQKRPSVRARKQGGQASKSPRNSSFSDKIPPLAGKRLSTKFQRPSGMQSDEGAGATRGAPSQVVGDARGLTQSAKGRKRTIMARYVVGDEDKPGERWKRRLLRSR